eukprot:CAMPEP_0116849454 /NCGR_PEP_ID=MMETSP0418-20121206/15586_1 /TAXON_ID=1158023 /ORGANISM="Astrosyne radiata, Strain 13vi08-1A" /LENGTH=311 /DNA_ID=CAMNT_0004481187 /DNA_START=341 /DNA_END=1276 /DNA_ORIENTATION=+
MSTLAQQAIDDVESNDEKYSKARRQSRANLMVVVGFVLFVCVGSWGRLKGNKQLSEKGRLSSKEVSLSELRKVVRDLDEKVRKIKAEVDIFETDPKAKAAALELQDATRTLLHHQYGPNEPYRIKVVLEFQDTIPDFAEHGKNGEFVIEMAPSELVPHSVFTFMEIARLWRGGAFHRIAGHVLQVMVKPLGIKHLAFQEYSPNFPHKKGTVGYAGRPSGPAWYVSIENNTRIHGPGSQQKRNPYEADSCFGKVIEGYATTVMRIAKVPGSGFLRDAKKHVLIRHMIIMVPKGSGSKEYVEWKDNTKDDQTS